MNLLLVRYSYTPRATLGRLIDHNGFVAFTLEDGWRASERAPGGEKNSCVPDGLYELMPHNSPKHPNTRVLVNPALGVYHHAAQIPGGLDFGRCEVLIHSGNTPDDTEGCILLGANIAFAPPRVLDSRATFVMLQSLLSDRPCTLMIRPSRGTSESYQPLIEEVKT